jgi:glycerol-3-phosphate acyltransferase PlsY
MKDSNHFIVYLLLTVLAYLLGSVPWGVLLTRIFTSIDIRAQGSGNIGATNVSRVAGSTLGILTFAGDVLKGAISVYLAFILTGEDQRTDELLLATTALASFFGHLYPVYMKFKGGGKGVATCAGCFVVLAPLACLASLAVFVVMLLSSKRVSVGSLAAATLLPWVVWYATEATWITISAVVMSIFIVFHHSANIKRLISGTEPRFKERQ